MLITLELVYVRDMSDNKFVLDEVGEKTGRLVAIDPHLVFEVIRHHSKEWTLVTYWIGRRECTRAFAESVEEIVSKVNDALSGLGQKPLKSAP